MRCSFKLFLEDRTTLQIPGLKFGPVSTDLDLTHGSLNTTEDQSGRPPVVAECYRNDFLTRLEQNYRQGLMGCQDTPYPQTWVGLRLQVKQVPQQLMLKEGKGSLLRPGWHFPQFPPIEIAPTNSTILVLHETILILPKHLPWQYEVSSARARALEWMGRHPGSAGPWFVTPGQVFNLLDVQFAPLKNVIEILTS